MGIESAKPALYFRQGADQTVTCLLCPHTCTISEGGRGICGVRANHGGMLYSLVYGQLGAVHIDPIEKKPLYHFIPGSRSLSMGTAGCNLGCMHCQNFDLSTSRPDDSRNRKISPEQIVDTAIAEQCRSISYTYNEPSVNYEYALETAQLAHQRGIKNVMVTNGYINPAPLRQLYAHIDAANIDLKGFDDAFYRDICAAKLKPVLTTITLLAEMKVWIEITNLLIPGRNDDDDMVRRMCAWIRDTIGDSHPLHFSAFHPAHRMRDVKPTPLKTLQRAESIARDAGLRFVYLGNAGLENPTACPACNRELITRHLYTITQNSITDGTCTCGAIIPGIWD